jgi:hypothetical protein
MGTEKTMKPYMSWIAAAVALAIAAAVIGAIADALRGETLDAGEPEPDALPETVEREPLPVS